MSAVQAAGDLRSAADRQTVEARKGRGRRGWRTAAVYTVLLAGGLVILEDRFLFGLRRRITDLALMHRLPAVYAQTGYIDAGGLAVYAPDIHHMIRRSASYVDRILKGAKPADLPVEQPTKFELVIKLKTAKAIGLTIPPSVLGRADQVIE